MPPHLDLSLFRWVDSQTSDADRLALLSLREAVCAAQGTYSYLEVGSFLGGSLQPHVVDPRCTQIVSLDPRRPTVPDDRQPEGVDYADSSTSRMLELLSRIPDANIDKIRPIEACSWEVPAGTLGDSVHIAFIDGEHTHTAVLRDFAAVRPALASEAVLAFHDHSVTPMAFLHIDRTLRRREGAGLLHFPGSDMVAVVQGTGGLRSRLLDWGWREGTPLSPRAAFAVVLRQRYPRTARVLSGLKRRLVRGA